MKFKCAVCDEPATSEFINPNNPEDRASYCTKHFNQIRKAFGNFQELYHYEKNIQQNPLLKGSVV